jgi:hypothetical protein
MNAVEERSGTSEEYEREHHVDAADLVRIGLVALAVLVSWLLPCSPRDALRICIAMGLDAMIIGDLVLEKTQ